MSTYDGFFEEDEAAAIASFRENGYYLFDLDNRAPLDRHREFIYQHALSMIDAAPSLQEFFDNTQKYVTIEQLNEVRVSIIQHMAKSSTVRPLVYNLAKRQLHWLVGNELAMQRACNLSMQLPRDESSLLPIHSDVWSGNSPYEVVFWLPLVDCWGTKSMYVLPRGPSDEIFANFEPYSKMSADELFHAIEDDVTWIDVKYGQGLIFSHSILHGNRINQEATTRWSMNTRFKSLLSPYGDKGLGESFLPITVRPATRAGYEYILPEVPK